MGHVVAKPTVSSQKPVAISQRRIGAFYLRSMHFRLSGVLRLIALVLAAFNFQPAAFPQRPPAQPDAAEILHKMQKLNVLGSVLYIVAHPDDENTRLITWLANGKKVRTGNLSLTRGDGGQNLIGPELGDALGIIRTQELLEARRIDGGEQFFTRAVDFGYSKSAAESFDKWGKQELLSDVVRVIRTFRPDVIITRFPPTREAGHGHHEASAILAEEAFDLAGDPKAFPEQLDQGLEVWQPRRLFFNGSTWWKKDLADIAKNDPDWFSVDVGGYDPLLGVSYTELAGRSRSMHKSQGFGAAETRGESLEYLKFLKGDRPKTKNIFDGIDMTWGRVKSAPGIEQSISNLLIEYSPTDPSASTTHLALVSSLILESKRAVPNAGASRSWYDVKLGEVDRLYFGTIGLVPEALSSHAQYSGGDSIQLDVQVLSRVLQHPIVSAQLMSFHALMGTWVEQDSWKGPSTGVETPQLMGIGHVYRGPFWLERSHGTLYDVPVNLIGSPVTGPTNQVTLEIDDEVKGTSISARIAPMHKWVDRVDGERIRPVYVTPVASVIPKASNRIGRGGTQTIEVEVEALTDSLTGQLNITLPPGWSTTKDIKRVNITKRNERQRFTFQLMPGDKAAGGVASFEFVGPKGKADRTLHEIDYPHIMPQVYYTPAEVKLVPLDVSTTAKTVGYVKGAGDDVPQALEQLGVTVEMIDPATASAASPSF